MRVSFPIVFVSDMARSVSFYRDVLGLPLGSRRPNGRGLEPTARPWRSTRATGPIPTKTIRTCSPLEDVAPASRCRISMSSTDA